MGDLIVILLAIVFGGIAGLVEFSNKKYGKRK